MAAVAGGLRRWLRGRGETGAEMRAQVPVSMHGRAESADQLSNLDSFIYVDLPLEEDDPVRRLERINAETVDRKAPPRRRRALPLLSRPLARQPALPRGDEVSPLGPREFSLSISNVPGPREAVYVLGGEVSDLHRSPSPPTATRCASPRSRSTGR